MPRDGVTGFIITQDDCTGCPYLSECLKVALRASAQEIKKREMERDQSRELPQGYDAYIRSLDDGEPMEEAEPGGVVGFLKRWSRIPSAPWRRHPWGPRFGSGAG